MSWTDKLRPELPEIMANWNNCPHMARVPYLAPPDMPSHLVFQSKCQVCGVLSLWKANRT